VELKKAVFFLAKFLVIFSILQFLIISVDLSALENALAQLVAQLLHLSFSGNEIQVPSGGAFVINNQCTGLLSGAVLAAVVFSLQKPSLRKKFEMFLAGAIVLFLLNIPRLLLVVWVGREFGLAAADAVHVGTWLLTTVLVLAAWFVGTRKIAKISDFSELL